MKKLIILSIALFSVQSFAGEKGFSQDLTGTYALVSAVGTEGRAKDCDTSIDLKVENNKLIINDRFEKDFSNGCNEDGRYRFCEKSSALSYEYFDHYVDHGMNLDATKTNKIALSSFNKNKLTVTGNKYINFVLFRPGSPKVVCTYNRM